MRRAIMKCLSVFASHVVMAFSASTHGVGNDLMADYADYEKIPVDLVAKVKAPVDAE